jgi:phage gp45-like
MITFETMSGPKQKLGTLEEEDSLEGETREVFLRDGRKVVVTDGSEQLVEIRSQSGMVELRIRLTEEGPVLQMETVRMQLKATEAVEIDAPRVEIKGTEQLSLQGGDVEVKSERDTKIDADGNVRVVGTKIHLN